MNILLMNNKVVAVIKKHPRVFIIAKCIKCISKDPVEFYKLMQGFYGRETEQLALIINHAGEDNSEHIIYHIAFGVYDKSKMGFFALMRWTLGALDFAERFGFIPVVEWGEGIFYYDNEIKNKNAFEYYFLPVSDISYNQISSSNKIIISKYRDIQFLWKDKYSILYDVDDKTINKLADIYKKYVHLNEETSRYIDASVKALLREKKILGIHVRGTDFAQGVVNHPVMVSSDEYIREAREVFSAGKYDGIFLATDDLRALRLFEKEFGEKLYYYTDVIRSETDVNPFLIDGKREKNNYKLGLEVLRDVYTLAQCNGLIAGLTQVSFAVRYISVALGHTFDEVVILDKGILEKGKAEFVVDKKQR